jgi:hypothetical protein
MAISESPLFPILKHFRTAVYTARGMDLRRLLPTSRKPSTRRYGGFQGLLINRILYPPGINWAPSSVFGFLGTSIRETASVLILEPYIYFLFGLS